MFRIFSLNRLIYYFSNIYTLCIIIRIATQGQYHLKIFSGAKAKREFVRKSVVFQASSFRREALTRKAQYTTLLLSAI